jgi:hypothetical protein
VGRPRINREVAAVTELPESALEMDEALAS